MASRLARRSGRLRTANRRYKDDAFEAIEFSAEDSGAENLAEEQGSEHVSDEGFATSEDNEQDGADEDEEVVHGMQNPCLLEHEC